jgi:hypothetical protein
LTQLEERIRKQEISIQRLAGELQEAGKRKTFERVQSLGQKAAQAQAALDGLIEEWERLAV